MTNSSIYTDGAYLKSTGGTWHLEDSPFKARQVLAALKRNQLQPRSVCEIGCGAGGVLAELSNAMPETTFVGYEISPQAHELAVQHWSGKKNLSFRMCDAFEDQEKYDVVLLMDVVEHIEDYFTFLRQAKAKGEWKVYHIPLEISCLTVLRDYTLAKAWREVGHLHSFTRATAMQALQHTGHEIVDWFYTNGGLECPKRLRTHLANTFRRFLRPSFSSRLLGGYSLLALAR